jgi:hypothetical protein
VALVGLLAATVHVARSGTWFLLLLAYPAARALPRRSLRRRPIVLCVVVLVAAAAALLVKGPQEPGSSRLAALAARSGRPVLAEALLGQEVALDGGRVWVENPIDAFRPADQSLYLDWLAGKPSGAAALSHAAYVLVEAGSAPGRAAAADPRLRRVAANRGAVLYRVRTAR